MLLALAAIVYYLHFLIFRDLNHIFIYFVGDVAFVFFEVLLVALVIHRLLHHREEKAMREKLNMLKGAFFSEAGTALLRKFADFDAEFSELAGKIAVPSDWSEREFLDIRQSMKDHTSSIEAGTGDLEAVRDYLREKKHFLLDLLQNPNLIEDEAFTDLVWATFHLAEELSHRRDLKGLSEEEISSLEGDIKRVYHLLMVQWTEHINHLKTSYPYLFSLASKTNPFEGKAAVEAK